MIPGRREKLSFIPARMLDDLHNKTLELEMKCLHPKRSWSSTSEQLVDQTSAGFVLSASQSGAMISSDSFQTFGVPHHDGGTLRFQSSVYFCSEDVVGPLTHFYFKQKDQSAMCAISKLNNLLLVPFPRDGTEIKSGMNIGLTLINWTQQVSNNDSRAAKSSLQTGTPTSAPRPAQRRTEKRKKCSF